MAMKIVVLALGEHPAPAMELCSLCTGIVEDYFVDDEYEKLGTTSGMLDADLLEVPVRRSDDGDFYFASDYMEATHLLRVALSEKGYEHSSFEHTHDIVFYRNSGQNEADIADELCAEGWVMLWGYPKRNDADWAVLVSFTPHHMKLFWASVYKNEDTVWLTRPVHLLPFLQAEEAVNRYRRKRKQTK